MNAGIAEAALKLGWDRERSRHSTNRLRNSAYQFCLFFAAARMARNRLLCKVNGDIMLTDGLIRAISLIRKRKFLMVGRRWGVNLTEPRDFPI
jgi:hypothetical protein